MKKIYIVILLFIMNINAYSQNKFITTWVITSANETIIIPTSGTIYNYSIDLGDGTIESGKTGNTTYGCALAGTHTVSIHGDFRIIYFNGS